jgi:hypothetical protein
VGRLSSEFHSGHSFLAQGVTFSQQPLRFR